MITSRGNSSCQGTPCVSGWTEHLMIVLREYEDFYNTIGHTAP